MLRMIQVYIPESRMPYMQTRLRGVAAQFGGYTETHGVGRWVNPVSMDLIAERVSIITVGIVFVDTKKGRKSFDLAVYSLRQMLVEPLLRRYGEQAVMLVGHDNVGRIYT